jgi:hypothetical protein
MKVKMAELAKEMNTTDMFSLLKKIEFLTDFTLSVKNKELQQEIIKKISPLLCFDTNKYKEIMEIEE